MALRVSDRNSAANLEEVLAELRRASRARREARPGSREQTDAADEERRLADEVWRVAHTTEPDST
jgi:hypothetical protein